MDSMVPTDAHAWRRLWEDATAWRYHWSSVRSRLDADTWATVARMLTVCARIRRNEEATGRKDGAVYAHRAFKMFFRDGDPGGQYTFVAIKGGVCRMVTTNEAIVNLAAYKQALAMRLKATIWQIEPMDRDVDHSTSGQAGWPAEKAAAHSRRLLQDDDLLG